MALKDEVNKILASLTNERDLIIHNRKLYEIHEGDLQKYVMLVLQQSLNQKAFEQIKDRVAPINVLKRLIDKLSKIYVKPPKREIVGGGTDVDKKLLEYYQEEMALDNTMAIANRMFNLHKCVAIEPYLDNGKPRLRVLPFERFMPYSADKIVTNRMTHFTKIMGKRYLPDQRYRSGFREEELYYIYSDQEFLPVNSTGSVQTDVLTEYENSGVNTYGKIPAVVINRSYFDIIPIRDSDTLAMTLLIPVLLSDVNFAVKFQAFSIIYGINLTDEGLKFSPSAFWNLKSDPEHPEMKPEIGSIKPQVDSDKVLALIQAQIAMWMQSRNVKPGDIGKLTVENVASGVAKMLDDMDTSEDRQEQVPFFVNAEARLWDLIINHMHPVWVEQGEIENKLLFTPGAQVKTTFPEQRPIVDRGAEVNTAKTERDAGFTTTKRAIQRLNPDMSEQEVDELITEIKDEKALVRSEEIANAKADNTNPNQEPSALADTKTHDVEVSLG